MEGMGLERLGADEGTYCEIPKYSIKMLGKSGHTEKGKRGSVGAPSFLHKLVSGS